MAASKPPFDDLLFGHLLLDDIDSDEDGIILSVVFVPVHRGSGLAGRVTWVESV